ncbi:hypothetical protein SKAU_G00034540 [Synaphobranchus kaupii]|uniref:Uncharacterized protein n=1 Tax=Synaphobranchus kaupii TaxID=118154 RepID=A0A9Q1JDI2_SYNKA|nr:hypothetical protein SKAU_G00034540 [Synaphobranchus kaupii]
MEQCARRGDCCQRRHPGGLFPRTARRILSPSGAQIRGGGASRPRPGSRSTRNIQSRHFPKAAANPGPPLTWQPPSLAPARAL